MTFIITAECCCAECRYAECHYAECRYAECRGAFQQYNLVLIINAEAIVSETNF